MKIDFSAGVLHGLALGARVSAFRFGDLTHFTLNVDLIILQVGVIVLVGKGL